jgi:hypothetical protein
MYLTALVVLLGAAYNAEWFESFAQPRDTLTLR